MPFDTIKKRFSAKTGSGQTQEKLRKAPVVLRHAERALAARLGGLAGGLATSLALLVLATLLLVPHDFHLTLRENKIKHTAF